MRGVTIVVAACDEARLRSALGIALSVRALDGGVRLFLDTAAVARMRAPIVGEQDAKVIAAGLPGLAAMIDEALDAGVAVILCQAGMALAGLDAGTLDPRLTYGGMVGLLAALGDDRLAVV